MIGNTSILASPFGPIFLAASSKGLTHCCFQDPWLSPSKQITLPSSAEDCDHHHHHPWKEEGTQQHLVLQLAETQLREYFAGQRQEFNLPLDLSSHGTTDFQLQVWTKLQSIPYGTTKSYFDIAKAIGNPKAVRAVGNANNKNPILIIVPCHRVIGKDGTMKGYGGGGGVDVKHALLALERWIPAGITNYSPG